MSTAVQEAGELMKARRNEMALSLKEVATATSIRLHYLRAIEEGNIQEHISEVYALGFIRQYALYLGLDGDEMVEGSRKLFEGISTAPGKDDFSYGLGAMEVRGSPARQESWFPSIVWLALTAGLLAGTYYLARYLEVI